MTIDEAIAHALEVAEDNEYASKKGIWFLPENEVNDIKEQCSECAADHRQLAEWLRELKELRNSVGAIKLASMKDALNLISDLRQHLFSSEKELSEAKRLLKLALEQNNPKCKYCIHDLEDEQNGYNPCCTGETANCKWIYADEALKLIGGTDDGQTD